jgi:hypothetical protein
MRTLSIALFSLFITGCSVLGIGDVQESPCDGECSFKEAGVCADAISIYKHRGMLENRKVKEHWFSEDEDPYYENSQSESVFQRLNDEEISDQR